MNIVLRRLMNFRILEYKSKADTGFRTKGKIKSAYDVDSKKDSDSSSSDGFKGDDHGDLGVSILDMTKNNKQGGFRDYGKTKPQTLRAANTKAIYRTHDHSMLKSIQQDHAKNLSNLLRKSKDPTKTDQSKILKNSAFKRLNNQVLDDSADVDENSVINFNVALRTPIDDLGEEATTTAFIDGVHSNRTQKHTKIGTEFVEFDLLTAKAKQTTVSTDLGRGWSSPIELKNVATIKMGFSKLVDQQIGAKQTPGLIVSPKLSSKSGLNPYQGTDIEATPDLQRLGHIPIIGPLSPDKQIETVKGRIRNDESAKVGTNTLVNQLMKEKLQGLSTSTQLIYPSLKKVHSRFNSGFDAATQSLNVNSESSQGQVPYSPNMTTNMSAIIGSIGHNSSMLEADEHFQFSLARGPSIQEKSTQRKKSSSKTRKKKPEEEISPTMKKSIPNNQLKSSNSIVMSKSSYQKNSFSQLLKTISRKDSDIQDSKIQDSGSQIYSPQKKMGRNHAHGQSMNSVASQNVGGFWVNISNNVVTTNSRESVASLIASEQPKPSKHLRRLETGSFNFVSDSKNITPELPRQEKSGSSNLRSHEQVVIEDEHSPFSALVPDSVDNITIVKPTGPQTLLETSNLTMQTDIRKNKHYQKIFKGLTINPELERISQPTKAPFSKQKTAYLDSSPTVPTEFSPLRPPVATTKAAFTASRLDKDFLGSSSKQVSLQSDRKFMGSAQQIKTFTRPSGQAYQSLVLNPLTERKRNPSIKMLSKKRFSKPAFEQATSEVQKTQMPNSKGSVPRFIPTSSGNLASPSNVIQVDIDTSGDLQPASGTFKRFSIEQQKDFNSNLDENAQWIGHVLSGNESVSLSSIKNSSTLRSGVLGRSNNLDEFVLIGKNLLDCDSLKNLQYQLFNKQRSGQLSSPTAALRQMETTPTESDTTLDFDSEPDIKCLDMVTQISKSRLSKNIRSIFAKYGLSSTLVTSKSSNFSEFDIIVWTLKEMNLQWMLQVYDLKDFRYIDHSLVSMKPTNLQSVGSTQPKLPLSLLPVWAQQTAHSIMLEIFLLLQHVSSSPTN